MGSPPLYQNNDSSAATPRMSKKMMRMLLVALEMLGSSIANTVVWSLGRARRPQSRPHLWPSTWWKSWQISTRSSFWSGVRSLGTNCMSNQLTSLVCTYISRPRCTQYRLQTTLLSIKQSNLSFVYSLSSTGTISFKSRFDTVSKLVVGKLGYRQWLTKH